MLTKLQAQAAIREPGVDACCPARLLSRRCDHLLSGRANTLNPGVLASLLDPPLSTTPEWPREENFLVVFVPWPPVARKTKKFPLFTDKGRVPLATRHGNREKEQ